MRRKYVVLTLTAAVVCAAYSQPPAPTPTKAATQEQQTAKDQSGKGAVENPGFPTGSTYVCRSQSSCDGGAQEQKASPEMWAILIAALTFGAICVQAWIYWKQSRIMRAALDINRRPKLVIRRAEVDSLTEAGILMQCSIVNIGDDDGIIIESPFKFEFSDGQQFQPIEAHKAATLTSPDCRVHPGGEIRAVIRGTPEGDGALASLSQVETRPEYARPLYLRGWIYYRDKKGIHRRTRFSRMYAYSAKRFTRTLDQDYDTED
jgi:hypothetical protein